MRLSVSIGTFKLLGFTELNLASLRSIFGPETPILISDGKHENSGEMEALAARYDASYLSYDGEDKNHFAGCMQNTLAALAFARHNGSDICLKINQRFVLANDHIKQVLANAFAHEQVDIALPGRPNPHTLLSSRFFASFPFLVDCIFMRTNRFDPHYLKRLYEQQWRSRQDKYGTYTEIFWMNLLNGPYRGRYAVLNCLTDHALHWPLFFLRKCQNTSSDFVTYAQSLGLNHLHAEDFPVVEWSQIKGQSYLPFPRC